MKLLATLAIALTLGMSSVSADVTLDNLNFIRTAGADFKVVYIVNDGSVSAASICADRALNAGGVIVVSNVGVYTNVLCE